LREKERVTGRRGKRGKQVLDDLKETIDSVGEKALDEAVGMLKNRLWSKQNCLLLYEIRWCFK
jgi:hypothetical protein